VKLTDEIVFLLCPEPVLPAWRFASCRIRSRTRRETLSPKSALRFAILQRRTPTRDGTG